MGYRGYLVVFFSVRLMYVACAVLEKRKWHALNRVCVRACVRVAGDVFIVKITFICGCFIFQVSLESKCVLQRLLA